MADPEVARLTQLRNIEARTGRRIADLQAVLAASGLAKVSQWRSLLMERFSLGYGDANAVALMHGKPLPVLPGPGPTPGTAAAPAAAAAAAGDDALDLIYAGPKAGLRPLHDALMGTVRAFGDFEVAPKKNYLSLRRRRQFAMVGPATRDLIEIGLNAKDLPAHPRLKVLAPGGMCQATTRIGSADEIDAALRGWLRQAFDAAA